MRALFLLFIILRSFHTVHPPSLRYYFRPFQNIRLSGKSFRFFDENETRFLKKDVSRYHERSNFRKNEITF